MSVFKIIRTLPGDLNFVHFQNLPEKLYNKNSQRFIFGNEPVAKYLEACYILLDANEPVGRFAFYENPELIYDNGNAACIGSYECIENADACKYLLQFAISIAKEKSYKWLIGPMEGSTWNNYRFSNHNMFANFFLEPYHHIYYNQQFETNNFISIANYFSNIDSTMSFDKEKIDKFEQYYINLGAKFRKINMNDFRNELIKLAKCSIDGFSNNFLFTKISTEDFVSKYEKLKDYFDTEFVWIVEDIDDEIQAFAFAIPDKMDSTNQTLIIKSTVNKSNTKFKGISSYLIGKIVQTGNNKGYKRIIHAFMIRDNSSVNISKHYHGSEYKSYTLYGIKL